jgi:putative heme-binding domain-containing protein
VSALVDKLSDPNLTVRTLVANELVDRIGADATTALLPLAEAVFNETGVATALPLANVLERLGALDGVPWFETLLQAGDEAGATALRILSRRTTLAPYDESYFREAVRRSRPGFTWRAMAEVFARHPARWQAPLMLDMLARVPPKDTQLTYSLRLALKAVIADASVEQLIEWEQSTPRAGEFLSGVGLAVPQSHTAEYLLGYLERTAFAASNSGELARHAVQYLSADRYASLEPLVQSLQDAPLAQQLALAEGLALAAAKKAPLPSRVESWMKRVLTDIAGEKDPVLARRAIEAAEPIVFAEMMSVLRTWAVDRTAQQYPLRFVALRALPAGLENEAVFVQVLNEGSASNMLRKLAVDALGKAKTGPRGLDALVRAMPTVPSELALAIAAILAKSDAGADHLVQAVESGQIPARLLTHAYVAPHLTERTQAIRDQVASLTRQLPSENARLDALIAARSMAYNRARPKSSRGEAVFTEQCAACHKFRDVGGHIGPTLDGLAARGVPRLLEDILDPSRNIDPVFRLSTLTDINGATQTVMNLQERGTEYLMNDVSGLPLSTPKQHIKNVSVQSTSLMPGGFESALSEDDLFSLIAYLVSPSAESR